MLLKEMHHRFAEVKMLATVTQAKATMLKIGRKNDTKLFHKK